MSPVEVTAVLFGIACVYLTVRQNIWCWPTGLVMAALYIYIFGVAKLYSDAGLQVVYIFLQIYGWYQWLHGGRDGGELEVTPIRRNQALFWAAVAVLSTMTLGFLMDNYTDADLAYWDATTTCLSLVAQYLMAKKILECWIIWVTVDVFSVGIYSAKGLYLTAGLYGLFLGLATAGFFVWRQSMRVDEPEPVTA